MPWPSSSRRVRYDPSNDPNRDRAGQATRDLSTPVSSTVNRSEQRAVESDFGDRLSSAKADASMGTGRYRGMSAPDLKSEQDRLQGIDQRHMDMFRRKAAAEILNHAMGLTTSAPDSGLSAQDIREVAGSDQPPKLNRRQIGQ